MDRYDRIASEMKRVIADIIRNDVKDPRIPIVTSVTGIKLARDLKYAKVFISVFGDEAEKAGCMAALSSSSGFIRHEIGQKMTIRSLPELTFVLDESIEYGSYITEKLNAIKEQEANK